MNRLKDELDGIAGNFSKEQARLSSGFNRKLNKKSSRKPLYVGAIASLFLSIIGVAIFYWSTEITDDQQYSSDRPVYYNENVYKLYQSIFFDLEERNKQAFTGMISFLAIEHTFYEKGYELNEEEYKKAYDEAINRYKDPELSNEYDMFLKAAEDLNMSEKRFLETILAPIETKLNLYTEMLLGQGASFHYSLFLSSFESTYEKEINDLANELGVVYEKIINYDIYEGVIVAIQNNQILVVDGATSEDIATMGPTQIIEKYNTGVWFNYEHLEQPFLIGDRVLVSFDDIDSSVPAHTRANLIEIMERQSNSAVYYDENLFHYFALHFSHIEDEQLQKEWAFELYIEWLDLMEDAYLFGYAFDEAEYTRVKEEVLKQFETTISAPLITQKDFEAYALKLNIPVDQFIHRMAEVETHQRLVHEWKDGNAISMYAQSRLDSFKIENEETLNKLAQNFGMSYIADEFSTNIPFYIGKVVENKDGNIYIITGKTVGDTVLMTQDEITQRYDSGLWFNANSTPRISVGDVVKVHYDSLEFSRAITEPVVPIKISIIKDVK